MSISPISFGYSHPLKTMWQQGYLPTVKVGIYGDRLTPANITLEHIIPASQFGATDFSNLALATKAKNAQRGTQDIFLFTTAEKINEYLNQFKNIQVVDFSGYKYIQEIKRTLTKIKGGFYYEHF